MSEEHPSEATNDAHLRALGDIYEALTGIGVELEALVKLARFAVLARYGEDPLSGTLYDQDRDE